MLLSGIAISDPLSFDRLALWNVKFAVSLLARRRQVGRSLHGPLLGALMRSLSETMDRESSDPWTAVRQAHDR